MRFLSAVFLSLVVALSTFAQNVTVIPPAGQQASVEFKNSAATVVQSKITSTDSAGDVPNAFKLWHSSNGPMLFSTNGVERMRILGDGKIAVNSTDSVGSPATRFGVLETSPTGVGLASVLWLNWNNTDPNAASRAFLANAYNTSATENQGILIGNNAASWSRSGTLRQAIANEVSAGVCCAAPNSNPKVTTAIGTYVSIYGGPNVVTDGFGLYVYDIAATNGYGVFQVGPDDRNYFGGTVGIGVTNPTAALHIRNSLPLRIETTTGGVAEFRDNAAYPGSVMLDMALNGTISVSNLQIGALTQPVINSTGTALYLNKDSHTDVVVGAAADATRLRVEGTGVSTFGGAVTVAGDLTVNGNLAAKYQDLAEWVPSVDALTPGTVVVLDRQHVNHVVASTRSYDTSVAGVVSAQPGIALGVAGASKVLIATTGRVRVHVDASAGPIAIGDLLVTGGKPGVAMKSVPMEIQGVAIHRPGTVVGKALEPLDRGEGEILVLLSLQ